MLPIKRFVPSAHCDINQYRYKTSGIEFVDLYFAVLYTSHKYVHFDTIQARSDGIVVQQQQQQLWVAPNYDDLRPRDAAATVPLIKPTVNSLNNATTAYDSSIV